MSRIDPQTILAIYMRYSLNMYRAAHAKLSAQEFSPDHFYTLFQLRCQERHSRVGGGVELVIKEMGEEVGLPPCLMARFILKSFVHLYPSDQAISDNGPANMSLEIVITDDISELTASSSNVSNNNGSSNSSKMNKASTARITKLLRDPDQLLPIDPFLHSNLLHCLQTDFLTSPLTDHFRYQIGVEKEVYMHKRLAEMGVLFHSEADMRAAGYPKTPDALLAYPVEIDGHIVNWIESKALFSDFPTHQTYQRDQYWPYFNRFGPGLVIYWFGFLDEINSEKDREKGILVMDSFPEFINKIKY